MGQQHSDSNTNEHDQQYDVNSYDRMTSLINKYHSRFPSSLIINNNNNNNNLQYQIQYQRRLLKIIDTLHHNSIVDELIIIIIQYYGYEYRWNEVLLAPSTLGMSLSSNDDDDDVYSACCGYDSMNDEYVITENNGSLYDTAGSCILRYSPDKKTNVKMKLENKLPPSSSNCLCFDDEGNYYLSSCDSKCLMKINGKDNRVMWRVDCSRRLAEAGVAFHPETRLLYSIEVSVSKSILCVINPVNGEFIDTLAIRGLHTSFRCGSILFIPFKVKRDVVEYVLLVHGKDEGFCVLLAFDSTKRILRYRADFLKLDEDELENSQSLGLLYDNKRCRLLALNTTTNEWREWKFEY